MTTKVIDKKLWTLFPRLFRYLDKQSDSDGCIHWALAVKSGTSGIVLSSKSDPNTEDVIDTRHLKGRKYNVQSVYFGVFTVHHVRGNGHPGLTFDWTNPATLVEVPSGLPGMTRSNHWSPHQNQKEMLRAKRNNLCMERNEPNLCHLVSNVLTTERKADNIDPQCRMSSDHHCFFVSLERQQNWYWQWANFIQWYILYSTHHLL